MIYQKKEQQQKLQTDPSKTKVRDYFGPYQSLIDDPRMGIEIEVEAINDIFPMDEDFMSCSKQLAWRSVVDGSLRNGEETGRGGREFISSPLLQTEVEDALRVLDTVLSIAGTKIRPSIRTSVHVHMNAQNLTLKQLVQWIATYYCLEPLLSYYNGETREDNLFCLQARFTPLLIDGIQEFLTTRRFAQDYKYAALNLMPLMVDRYGTLEFRAGKPIEKSPLEIIPWTEMLWELYHFAISLDDPSQIMGMFSEYGPIDFISEKLPCIYKHTLDEIDIDEKNNISELMYQSLRHAQQLVFDIDWSDHGEVPLTKKHPKKKKSRGIRIILDERMV